MPNPINKIHWTKEMDQFLKDNWHSMSNRELADYLRIKLTSTRMRLYELGFKRMEMEYWTEEQIQFLKDNYKNNGDTEIAEYFNSTWNKNKGWSKKHIEKKRRYLKLKRTEAQKKKIHKRNTDQGRFSVNHWKRWDGTLNPIGTIVIWNLHFGLCPHIKTESGYIKLAHYNWINKNGVIPEGHVIINKDKNNLNCEVENLELISKAENMKRNGGSVILSDGYVAGMLTHNNPELRQEILKYPEFIEAKRQQLQLNRLIQHHDK